MTTNIKIPTSVKNVTAEWLTTALHSIAILDADIAITDAKVFEVEEGGFHGTVLRLNLTFTATTSCPPNFILKLVTTRKGDNSGDKELYFYQNVDRIALPPLYRAPKAYLSLNDGDAYLFLLEDLGELKHIPQKLGGADYETAKRIVIALATFHAKYWRNTPNSFSEIKEEFCPVAEQDSYWENLQSYMTNSIDDFNSLVHDEELHKTSKFCAEHLAELVKKSHKSPCTLIHGDARLSNYFLEGERGVVAVDWQGFNVGSGPGELAYFLSMNVQEDVRKKSENEFLHLYYDILVKRGAFKSSDEFSFDQCYQKYIIGVATSSALPILTARRIIEGRKVIAQPPPNIEEKAKIKIAMHDYLKPMIDLWCTTAHNHPITSLTLEQ